MSVKVERANSTKIIGKGVLVRVDEEGFHFEDIKTQLVEVLPLAEIAQFIGREGTLTYTNKEEIFEG